MCNETPIDTSNWPQPGEIWKTREGLEYGPLRLSERGVLTDGNFTWTPSGHCYMRDEAFAYDLIVRVVKLPEPIERFIRLYDSVPVSEVVNLQAYPNPQTARDYGTIDGKTFRTRITFLEEVK